MPKGVAASGLRLTKQRREALAATDPDMLKALQPKGYQPKYKTQLTLVRDEPEIPETDAEIEARLSKSFEAMEIMAEATARGINRSFIIAGPPGLGKSFGVEKKIDQLGAAVRGTIVKGYATATGLYKKLYEYRHSNCVLILDDCDSIFGDETALNFLKTACDTTEVRTLSYLTDNVMVDDNGQAMPRNFVFEGSVIFITNYRMDELIERGHKFKEHFEALISRSHYLDLGLNSNRDYIIRIKQVLSTGMLTKNGYTREEEARVLDYIEQKQDKLRELSLRMVIKLAGLLRMSPGGWMNLADVTCCKR